MYSGKVLSYQVLIVVALLLFLEGTARIAHTVYLNVTGQPDWFVYTADLGWDRRPNFSGLDDCAMPRTFDAQGLVSDEAARLQQKQEGQFRALFLGDSNTYGTCLNNEESFVGVANRLLPQSPSINGGVNGYTSYQGYKALLKYGKLIEPNIIFISFNFNDRRFAVQPELADSDAVFQRLYTSGLIRHFSEVSYLFWTATFVSSKLSPASPGAPRMIGSMSATEVRLDRVRPRVDARGYRENLTKMVQWAGQHGATVVFILLGDNPDQTYSLREGVKYLSEGNTDLAIKHLTLAKDESDDRWFSALARLYLSKAYRKAGMHDEAQQILSLEAAAGITGGYPIILDTEYHGIMREVADEHGVLVVDAARELNKIADVYWDFCHFDRRGHEIVGRLVANVIETAKMKFEASKH
jgi:lysophospholipase L1-like esterase